MENEENKSADISLGNQSVGRLLFRYAFPSALSLVCNAVYNIVDQVFIGRGVGYLGNGATNIIFQLIIFSLAVSSLIGDGSATYSARIWAGARRKRARSPSATARLPASCSGLFLVVTLIFPADAVRDPGQETGNKCSGTLLRIRKCSLYVGGVLPPAQREHIF